ncbi:MAG: hypothetical protein WCT53_02810 [Candidatus Gracilibacteria bacterium]
MLEARTSTDRIGFENLKADCINPSLLRCFPDALSHSDTSFNPNFDREVTSLSDDGVFALAATIEKDVNLCPRNRERLRLTREYCETPDETGVLPARDSYAQLLRQFLQDYPIIERQEYLIAADEKRRGIEREKYPNRADEFEAERRAYFFKRRRPDVSEKNLRKYAFPRILDGEDFKARIDRLEAEFAHDQMKLAYELENPPEHKSEKRPIEPDPNQAKLEFESLLRAFFAGKVRVTIKLMTG